jgi:DNA topoisomerase-1
LAELWVIEAPGKARTLEGILQRLGIEARVQATKGHLLSMPDRLTPLGIDSRLHEFMREPRDMDVVTRLRDIAREALSTGGRVVIATDADQEGDVIAWDVAEIISDIETGPVRVRLRGMDDESVQEAIAAAGPVLKDDAVPGRTRALVDRMVGAAFSGKGVAVGRVGTALLGLVVRDQPTISRLRLSAPSKDGGRPWLAECDVKAPLDAATADRLAATPLPALDMGSQEPFTASPGHMGDIMVRAAETLDLSPAETAKAMQRTYEAGKLSYPRAGSRGMSRSSARKMQRILAKAGARFEEAAVKDKAEGEVHDAPHPIGNLDLSLDPAKLGADEGVRALIGRDLVRCGQRHVRQRAGGKDRLEKFLVAQGFNAAVATHVAGLDWRRDQGPRYPGQESWPTSQVVTRRPDAVMLEAAMEAGLGRPSTWANHIEGFMSRGLVDAQLQLTEKGKAWIKASPPALLDPKISAAIERACEKLSASRSEDGSREPWEVLANRIIGALPPEIRDPIVASVASEAPRPRRDFRQMAEPGIDLDAIVLEPALPVYAPPSD